MRVSNLREVFDREVDRWTWCRMDPGAGSIGRLHAVHPAPPPTLHDRAVLACGRAGVVTGMVAGGPLNRDLACSNCMSVIRGHARAAAGLKGG